MGSAGSNIFFPRHVVDFAVARYNAYDGSLDTTFGTGGRVITDFFERADEARAVLIEPGTEKIIVVGWHTVRMACQVSPSLDTCLTARLTGRSDRVAK